ncbi:MAG: tetratricopeptide repeat protein, partial [Deltaproteobacteria bacterium]|nr:tetratricopeptide repeat protein [Deltaproteobacteria bacterium]
MKSSLAFLAAAFTAASTLVFVPEAAAQSDADKALARDLSKDAAKALADGKYEEARDKFARAEALYHAPSLLVGLARAYVGLGKFVEAKEAYNQVLREKLPPNASEGFVRAQQDAGREIGTLDDKIGTGTIVVTAGGATLPSGLSATLDDQDLKAAAFGLKRPMNPGPHRLAVSAPGYDPVERRFDVAPRKDIVVDVKILKSAGALPPPDAGGSTAPTDTAPPTAPTATAATAGGAGPSGGGGMQRILGWSAIGVGGAGLLLGGITGGIAVARHGKLASDCLNGSCAGVPDAQARIDAYETVGTLSTV